MIGEGMQDDKQREPYPVKPPRSFQGKNSLISRDTEELGRRDHNAQDNGLLDSGHNKRKSCLGLRSVSGIPEHEDNRNYLIFEQEKGTRLCENWQKNLTRDRNDRQVNSRPTVSSNMKHEGNISKAGDDGYKEARHNETQYKFSENDEDTNQPQRHASSKRYPLQQGMQDWGPEEYQHTESPHQYRDFAGVKSGNKSDEFPQNSQFHNETIYYPSPNKDYSNRGKRQVAHSSERFQESFSNDNTVGTDDRNVNHERGVHERSHHGGNSTRHLSTWHSGNGFYDDDEFEDLDDVPLYSEIPYALILTGNVDENILRKSKKKQQQQFALEIITRNSGKKSDDKTIKKNKNQSPSSTRNNTNSYEEQVLAKRKLLTDEDMRVNDSTNSSNFSFTSDVGTKESNNLNDMEFNIPAKGNGHSVDDRYGRDAKIKGEAVPDIQFENGELNNLSKALSGTDEIKEHGQVIAAKNKDRETSNSHSGLESVSVNKGNGENKSDAYSKEGSLNLGNGTGDILYSDRKVDKTVPEEFGKEMQKTGEEEKSLDRNEAEKSSNGESDRRKSEREIIREKRLKNINAKQMINVDNSSGMMHAPDHRDVAFNSDLIHKPVKSKAFRSKVPNFNLDENTSGEIVEGHKENDVDKQLPSKLGSNFSPAQSSNDSKDQKHSSTNNRDLEKYQTLTTCSEQNNTEIKKNEKIQKSEISEKHEILSEETNRIGAEGGNEEIDDGVIPIAMKLLKTQQDRKKSCLPGKDESMTFPNAMRILMMYRDGKDKKEKIQGASQQDKTDDKASGLFELLATLGATASMPKRRSQKITELDSRSSDRKPIKKNKNKNISPMLQKDKKRGSTERNEEDDEKDDSVIIFGGTTHQTEDGDVMSQEGGTETYTLKPLLIINLADKRHKAFQRIKMSQSEEHLKCTGKCSFISCQFVCKQCKLITKMLTQNRKFVLHILFTHYLTCVSGLNYNKIKMFNYFRTKIRDCVQYSM